MMASAEDIANLRSILAEVVPVGGDETDTLFTDARIGTLFDNAGGILESAAYEGWREKAGLYADLVNVTEGAASRELSTLQANALAMVKVYLRSSSGPTEGRTRIGRVVRPT